MERETKKLKTPLGKEVELRAYLTAGERRKIREAYLGAVRPEIGTDGKTTTAKIDAQALSAAEDRLIEMSVASFDGSNENILQRLLDGAPEDYDFVVNEASKLKQDFPKAK